jgi:hypothetical protein
MTTMLIWHARRQKTASLLRRYAVRDWARHPGRALTAWAIPPTRATFGARSGGRYPDMPAAAH